MRLKLLLASLAVSLAAAPASPAAAAPAPAPTSAAPIVVGTQTVSKGALEARAAQIRKTQFDPALSRALAAESLSYEAALRGELRRRGVPVRGRGALALERAAGRLIGGSSEDARAFVARFRAFQERWHAATRCTPGWAIAPPCLAGDTDRLPCVWAGAADVCAVTPAAPERPYWVVFIIPERFGGDSDESDPVERALRRRIARVPGLRARIAEIRNEGSITVSVEDERAAEILTREAFLLQRAMLR